MGSDGAVGTPDFAIVEEQGSDGEKVAIRVTALRSLNLLGLYYLRKGLLQEEKEKDAK